ncbi:HNH endonuclease [Acinetobacter baumannii]|nr:HNH endonuclease [Acinetobacter baumannii]
MAKVNLDALIPRADFYVDVDDSSPLSLGDKVKANELVKGESFFYSSLRKPDFQRETGDWDKEKIFSFVKSFIDGDLIPSIILWQSGSHIFVIDGAHRLSALIAWVNDDYGDGFISQAFFKHDVDQEQQKAASQTRDLINKKIGSYRSYLNAIKDQESSDPNKLKLANKLGFISLQIQWVSGGAEKAESSFFTINQKATPINDTEISLLKARKKPHALSARAIIRSGTGHNYWKIFDLETQEKILTLAKKINEAMFTPTLNTPIKTLDLPLAGKNYSSSSLALIFDVVKIANNINLNDEIPDDTTGNVTVKYLENTWKVIKRLTTMDPGSLGLHPALYFYSEKGRYQPTTLMAWMEIIKSMEEKNTFKTFTEQRSKIEDVLFKYKNLTNQVSNKYGSGLKSYKYLIDLYNLFMDNYHDIENLEKLIRKNYPYLNLEYKGDSITSSTFSSNAKSETFISQVLPTSKKCSICKAYIHVNSITIDHVIRKEDGGLGAPTNGALAHPYCNTTYKN